jgi:hypothetical protein
MEKIITARPNQSMLDIILMEYGTLEAGMAAMAVNNIDISHIPNAGSQWTMPEIGGNQLDKDSVAYLKQNNIVIGTLTVPELAVTILLKPVMQIIPTVAGAPHVLGYYAYDFCATPGFIHVHPLITGYLSSNPVNFQTEERYITGHPFDTDNEHAVTAMTALSIPYRLAWTIGNGYMMVWSDLAPSIKTATFRDIEGNTAYAAPLFLLDNLTEVLIEYYMADIEMEVISVSTSSAVVRLTRSHPPVSIADYSDLHMSWIGEATSGTPDPDDPTNADKIILTLDAGTHTVGIKTSYQAIYSGVPVIWPPSAFTMVIGVN